jgi:hypothetical protein
VTSQVLLAGFRNFRGYQPSRGGRTAYEAKRGGRNRVMAASKPLAV